MIMSIQRGYAKRQGGRKRFDANKDSTFKKPSNVPEGDLPMDELGTRVMMYFKAQPFMAVAVVLTFVGMI
eukprot:CAMPEP_0117429532 /NCGR_PEP_ID=MMETSP0758-20121206/9076_1 /TAXON_ID=63605 /ORGANISM="Percolomonas cosmopolitus, Strain AE-1 (ATCC 50343)" /LENGTH=69 /DNA_ID=CAMNT_0005216655 /DNA_START=13 /DNA_END=219 /DNA_ORIENTATION=-